MKITRHIVLIGMLFSCLILAGCGKDPDVIRSDVASLSLNTENVLGGESGNYPELAALLGNISYQQLLEVLQSSLDKMNVLAAQGATSAQDYQTVLNILSNMHTMMLEEKAEYEATGEDTSALSESSQALSQIVGMAADNHVGVVLNQVVAQTGPEPGIYPMIEYVLSAPAETSTGTSGGTTFNGFSGYDDFKTVMLTLNAIIDPQGKYPLLHDDLGAIADAIKTNEIKKLTFADARDLLATLMDAVSSGDDQTEDTTDTATSTEMDSEISDNLISVLDDLWENDARFRADLVSVIGEAGRLLANENSGDTDMGRIISVAQQLLAPGVRRTHLREFANGALHGLVPTSDGQTLEAMLEKITRSMTNYDAALDTTTVYSAGIGKGLHGMVTRNMYGQDRTTADVKTSCLRALIYMMQESNLGLTLLGIPELSMITSPDGGTVSDVTINTAKWSVGEIASAQQWARAYNDDQTQYAFMAGADDNLDGTVDKFEAFDWVLYSKRYRLMGLSIPGLTEYYGLVGTMTNPVTAAFMPVGITDPFAAMVELAGGIAPSGEGTDPDAYMNRTDTAGQRHKLFSLFAPLMEYFWDPNGDGVYSNAELRVNDMIMMLEGMNEIDVDPDQNPYITYSSAYRSLYYSPLTGLAVASVITGRASHSDATFRLDNSGDIVKLFDGGAACDGGMLAYLLRSHDGNAAGDGIILDHLLDMIVRIVFKLDSDQYRLKGGKTTYAGLMDAVDLKGLSEEGISDALTVLFDGKDGGTPLATSAYDLLIDNHDALVAITKPMGRLLVDLASVNSQTNTSQIEALINDGRDIWPILKDLVTTGEGGTETEDESTGTSLFDYLTQANEDGTDNPLMLHLKTDLYKILDVQDSTYNPQGTMDAGVPLTGPDGLLVHLTGGVSWVDSMEEFVGLENGLYDLSPLADFLVALSASPDIVWPAVHDGADMLDQIMGDESMSQSFLQSVVKPVDVDGDAISDGTVLKGIADMINLGGVDFDGVLGDVATLMDPENADLKPGSKAFDMLLQVLDFATQNATVIK
jgi:hypothetical protein